MPQPWERQPGETSKAYAAFCRYRDMDPGKRSLAAVSSQGKKCGKGGKPSTVIAELSAKHDWVARAAAYDDHMDEIRRKASEDALAEMSRKHAEGMREIFEKGLNRIKALDDEDIRGAFALELAISGMKGERLARGLATDSIAQTVNGGGQQLHPLGHAIQSDPAVREKAYELLNAASRRRAEGGQG